MNDQSKNGKTSVNMISNCIAFVIHAGIQFLIVPTLNQKVGNEAYGFINLANEFVQYASIFELLLNSVVGRFIAFEIHQGNEKRANQYFNSVIIADVLLSTIITIAGLFLVLYLDRILVISPEILHDVKKLFAITFLRFLIATLFSVFSVATFVRNRIDIAAIRNIVSYFVEIVVVIILFAVTPMVKVYYLTIGALISTVFIAITNMIITFKMMPEFRFCIKECKIEMIFNLLKTGVWTSIGRISSVLLGSTTLIMGNLFLGGNTVGLISLSKTLPNSLYTLYHTVNNVFTPNLVKYYAENKQEEMIEFGKQAMSMMTFIIMPIVVGVVVFAPEFFNLWLEGKTIEELETITLFCRIIIVGMIAELPGLPLSYFPTAINKIRLSTLFSIVCSFLFLVMAYIGLEFFGADGKLIVISQSVSGMIMAVLFTPIYVAVLLKKNWSHFLFYYLKQLIVIGGLVAIYIFLGRLFDMTSWMNFIIVVSLLGGIGYIYGFFTLLSVEQKKKIVDKLKYIVKQME